MLSVNIRKLIESLVVRVSFIYQCTCDERARIPCFFKSHQNKKTTQKSRKTVNTVKKGEQREWSEEKKRNFQIFIFIREFFRFIWCFRQQNEFN